MLIAVDRAMDVNAHSVVNITHGFGVERWAAAFLGTTQDATFLPRSAFVFGDFGLFALTGVAAPWRLYSQLLPFLRFPLL